MNYFVYALQSEKDKHLYIGMTTNLQARLLKHNSGCVPSTKARRPFKIVFVEDVGNDRQYAREREKYWKSGIGRETIKSQLEQSS